MTKYELRSDIGFKNTHKGGYGASVMVVEKKGTRCLVAYREDFKLRRDALAAGKKVIEQFKADYARDLGIEKVVTVEESDIVTFEQAIAQGLFKA